VEALGDCKSGGDVTTEELLRCMSVILNCFGPDSLRLIANIVSPMGSHDNPIVCPNCGRSAVWKARPMVEPEKDMLQFVETTYRFRSTRRVHEKLINAPYLLPLLLEIPAQVTAAFGEGTVLELDGDPIKRFEDHELTVGIRAKCGHDEALEKLIAFDIAWWNEHEPSANGKMIVILA